MFSKESTFHDHIVKLNIIFLVRVDENDIERSMKDRKTTRSVTAINPSGEEIRFQRISFDNADMARFFCHHDSFIGNGNHERLTLKRDNLGILEILLSFSPSESTITCNAESVSSRREGGGEKHPSGIQSQESSLPYGHWRARQRTVLAVSTPFYLQQGDESETRRDKVERSVGIPELARFCSVYSLCS